MSRATPWDRWTVLSRDAAGATYCRTVTAPTLSAATAAVPLGEHVLWGSPVLAVPMPPGRTVMQTNDRGEYVPAIPVPWLDPSRVRCSEAGCRRSWRHWTGRGRRRALQRFREHYAYAHVLALDPEGTSS